MSTTAPQDKHGELKYGQQDVGEILVDHFANFLGKDIQGYPASFKVIYQGPYLNEEHRRRLLQPFIQEEIKQAVFQIENNKSLGPDGYGSLFYKTSWGTIWPQVYREIHGFFSTSKLLC